MKNEQLFAFLKKFLITEKFKIDFEELRFQLLSHPYYPSLHSIVGALNHFKIANYPIQMDETEENLNDLPRHFLSKTNKSAAFVMVTKHKNKIKLVYEDLTQAILTRADFLKIWDGKILIVEATDNNIIKVRKINFPIIIGVLGAIFLIMLTFWNLDYIIFRLHFILGLFGLFVSGLILNKKFGGEFPLLDKVCNFSPKTDCDKVLESKEIKLPYGLELGDLALVYFTSVTVFWMLSVALKIDISVLLYLSILSVPITILSIYYQKFVIDSWCTLCLVLVGVLWLQLGVFSLNIELWSLSDLPGVYAILFMIFLMVQIMALWLLVKNYITKNKSLQAERVRFSKFKSNFELFKLAMDSGSPISPDYMLEDLSEIQLGNVNAETQIIMITNPTCIFCKEAYKVLRKAIDSYPDSIGLTIRFSVDITKPDSVGYRVAEQLISIYRTPSMEDIDSVLDILTADSKSLTKWLTTFDRKNIQELDTIDELLIKQKEWCNVNRIYFTPLTLINGVPFPKQYDVEDLLLVLSDLVDYNDGKLKMAI